MSASLKKTKRFSAWQLPAAVSTPGVTVSIIPDQQELAINPKNIVVGGGKRITIVDLLNVSASKYTVNLDLTGSPESELVELSDENIYNPEKSTDVIGSPYPSTFGRAVLFARIVSLMQGRLGVRLQVIYVIFLTLNDLFIFSLLCVTSGN